MVTLSIIFTNMTIRVKGRFLSLFLVAITECLRLGDLERTKVIDFIILEAGIFQIRLLHVVRFFLLAETLQSPKVV